MEDHIMLDGKRYELVTTQRTGESHVYRGPGEYLRIGTPRCIGELLRRHRLLARSGFPVPRILAEGAQADLLYYREQSLGNEKFGIIFKEEFSHGGISSATFDAFLQVLRDFTRAQIRAGALLGETSMLAQGIHLEMLLTDMPEHAEAIHAMFGAITGRLRVLPVVACHGDLNPQNMFSRGVIDFEDMYPGPLGYDQVSALITTELNPQDGEYEFIARYRFTGVQQSAYYEALDSLFVAESLPPLSTFRKDFEFLRTVWASTRMDEWPKTRAWRHSRIRTLLDGRLVP